MPRTFKVADMPRAPVAGEGQGLLCQALGTTEFTEDLGKRLTWSGSPSTAPGHGADCDGTPGFPPREKS